MTDLAEITDCTDNIKLDETDSEIFKEIFDDSVDKLIFYTLRDTANVNKRALGSELTLRPVPCSRPTDSIL